MISLHSLKYLPGTMVVGTDKIGFWNKMLDLDQLGREPWFFLCLSSVTIRNYFISIPLCQCFLTEKSKATVSKLVISVTSCCFNVKLIDMGTTKN